MELTHLSLFTGIGGLDLAAEWAGFTTVGQCEWADYPTKVLEKHWPEVPRWRDVRELSADEFYRRTGRRTVGCISGGFPCQPFSIAGKKEGTKDERYLWPEMLRVINELRPLWVVGENVSGLIRIALDEILESIESIGYAARAYRFTASEIGAPFSGERIAIVATTDDRSAIVWRDTQLQTNEESYGCWRNYGRGAEKSYTGEWWKIQPRPYGVADGIPNRVDRNKCLGNAVVPQQFYPIFKAIAELEAG